MYKADLVAAFKNWFHKIFLYKKNRLLFPVIALTVSFLILDAISSFAQGNFGFHDGRTSEKISFKYHRNLIIVPLFINGQGPFNFILDTGVNFIILTNPVLQDQLHLSILKTILVRGLGEGKDTKAGVVGNLNLQVGKIDGGGFSAAILPAEEFSFSNYVGMSIDGIIGYDLFKSFAIKIDYENEILTITKPEEFKIQRKYRNYPLSIENQRPYIYTTSKLPSGKSIKVKLILDTGAGHPISLEPGSDSSIIVPAAGLKSRLGIGLNGPIEGKLGRLPGLNFDGIELKNIVCSFPVYPKGAERKLSDDRNGNLGNEILSRFTIIFNYARQMIYLKANNTLKRPFEYDMSGLDLIASGKEYRNYIVTGIDPGSPADLSGLKENDIIMYINLVPAAQYSITEIDNLLRSGDKKKVNIVYQRGNQIGFTQIILKRRV